MAVAADLSYFNSTIMRVKINTRRFQNDMRSFKTKDDVLTLLIHLGYLGYDSTTKEAFIPNREIVEEFENAMSVGGWETIYNFCILSMIQLWGLEGAFLS